MVRSLSSSFPKDVVGDGHFADVVEESASSDDEDLFARHAHGAGDGNGESGNAAGVAFGFGVFEVECVAQSLQGDVVGAFEVRHGSLKLVGAGFDQRFQIGLVGAVFHLEAAILQSPAHGVE